jgi:hypothetical protein
MRKILLLGAAIALLGGSFLSAQPTHHWPLKADLNDVVGTLHGTNNGVTFENDGVRGPVAYFEGTSAYANLPSFVNGLTEITVACWFRMDESRVWSRIYSFGTGDQTEPKDVMMVIPVSGAIEPGSEPAHNMYRFTLSNPGDVWYDIDFPQAVVDIQLDTWYYSVVVLKPDSIILYHNDTQIFAESGFTRAFGTLDDSENALGKSFWPDPLWKGALSDLQVFNKALSPSEVVTLYNETMATGISDMDAGINVPLVYSDLNRIRVKLNQDFRDEVVSVFSLTGALIAQRPANAISGLTFHTGVYIVKVQGSNVNYATKVFVK